MSRLRQQLKPTGPEEIQTSSGVTVTVTPFPADLWSDIQARALRDYPDPEPPKRTIEVVDGTEEIDDTSDPEYQEGARVARDARNAFVGEAILDLCVDVDLDAYDAQVARLGKYVDVPENGDERRILFLTKYALRSRADYERVMVSATTQMAVSDPEVAERLEFFRREMARDTDNGADAPGADAPERVDV